MPATSIPLHPGREPRGRLLGGLLAATLAAMPLCAQGPLHVTIDAMLAAAHPAGQAPVTNDADFLRRASLVLHGMIPTSNQARAFFADPAPDKRAKLVDALIADPQFANWMAVSFDVVLMERRAEQHTKALPWREWLEESFKANKPWDALVREMLTSDGTDEKTRHIARWVLEREADQHALTKDASRLFLGRDIACAQCHDHPRIDDYFQRDYAGLQAFFGRTYLFQPDASKPGFVGEQVAGNTEYSSVFTQIGGETKPRLPGEPELAEQDPGEWAVAPDPKDKNIRPVPKYSRRALLARALCDGHHPAFRRNIANRLWAFVFGRGLVEPLDLDHSANPPSEPELLDMLAARIAEMKFDMRAFVRELALTHAFQRSLDLPDASADLVMPAAERIPQFEQEAAALAAAAAAADVNVEAVRSVANDASRAAAPVKAELAKLSAAAAETKKSADAAAAELRATEDALAAKRDAQNSLAEAAAKVGEALAQAGESPELAAAAKTFQTKSDAATTELAGIEKDSAAKKADAEAKAQSLAGAEQASAAAKTKVDEALAVVAAKHAELDAAVARRMADRAKAKNVARVAAQVKAAAAWAEVSSAAKPLREAANKAEAEFAAAKAGADRSTAELAAAMEKLAPLEAALVVARSELTTSKEAMTAKGPATTALAEAAAKAAEAAAKLPADEEVKSAAAAVKAKADAAAAEIAAIQTAAADAQGKTEAAEKALADARAAKEKAAADLAAFQPQLPALEAALAAAKAKAAEFDAPLADAREALSGAWARSFGAMELLPLSPEQLCWSVIQATGQFELHRAAATAEWDAKNNPTEADKADPAKQAARATAIEALLREKLRGHETQFVRSFGGAAGQPQTDFFATPEQALYFENGGVLRSWAANLASRAAALPEPKAMAEELYLSTLTRLPDDGEVALLAQTLAARPPEKNAEALADYAWALITSTEFRFLH